MSKISPVSLPWQTKHDFDIEGRTTIIGNVDGEIIDGTTHHTYDFVARTLDVEDDSQSHSVGAANADFIVRACNSHYELVEALTALTGFVEHTIKRADLTDTNGVVTDCRALIAKATAAQVPA